MNTEPAQEILDQTKKQMNDSVIYLKKELTKIRAGKPNPAILDSIKVDYYGSPSPIGQVSQVSVLDSKTLGIKPYEKNFIPIIERSIVQSNLDLNPTNNGEIIMLHFPPLTQETRDDLVKQTATLVEKGKVAIRNTRKDSNEKVKKMDDASEDMKKTVQSEIQKITDDFVKKMDLIFEEKKKDLTTI